MASATTVKLVISSEVRLVDVVHAAAEAIAGVAGFNEDDSLSVGIAVREAVINAIVHGNKQDLARKVEVNLQARPRSIRARVRDQGVGFDMSSTPDPTVGDSLMRTSGRGLLVMRAFVDRVDFKFREGRGMEVTMTKSGSADNQKRSTRPSVAAVDNGGIEK